MSVTFKDFSPKIKAQMERNIESALTAVGEQWKSQLAPVAIMAQPKFGPTPGSGAVDSGVMIASNVFQTEKRAVTLGNTAPWAIFVTVGTWKVPQRPWMQNSVYGNSHAITQTFKTHLGKGF